MTFESKIGWLRSVVSFAIAVLFLWVLRKLHTAYAGALWGVTAVGLQFAALKLIGVIERQRRLKNPQLATTR